MMWKIGELDNMRRKNKHENNHLVTKYTVLGIFKV